MSILGNIWQVLRQKIFGITKNVQETTTSQATLNNLTFSGNNFFSINQFAVDEFDVWYEGDSTKLLEFYSKAKISEYPSEYIRTRNCQQYFWAKTVDVDNIKRTTANLVRNITTTLTNIINSPKIYSSNEKYTELIKEMIEENDFYENCYDLQMAKTIYEGWGAYRIDIDSLNNDYPKIRYFKAQNVKIIKEDGEIKAVAYLSHYRNVDNKAYTLVEIRYVKYEDNIPYSCIDKMCFEVGKASYRQVELSKCDFLVDKKEHIEFTNVPFILGEASVFYEIDGLENEGLCGRSVFYGKIDALDDYDQALSLASTSIRRSTPKITYPVSSLKANDRTGLAELPNQFDTEFIAVPNQLTGDGLSMESASPKVVQPMINTKIYDDMMEYAMEVIIGGLISLNDIGLNEATFFRDSAEAIRERSRQTLYTINFIRRKERKLLTSLFSKCVFMKEMIWENKTPTRQDMKAYDIQVNYDKFLSPSKEQKIKAYLPMFQSGAISIEQFVRTVYEDEMSKEEMEKEIATLENNRMMAMNRDKTGGETFQKTASFDKNTSPYQDEVVELSDNSGMNNHNRGIKAIKDL